jgi:dienelactone hydrolase
MENELSPALYQRIKYFIPRLLISKTQWGDIVLALKDLNELPDDEKLFWQQWAIGWKRQAERYREKALQVAKTHNITAAHFWLKASQCWHWAEFMLFDNPFEKEILRRKVTEDFEMSMNNGQDRTLNKIAIPFNDLSLPAYLLLPDSLNNTSMPCVILINGLDSAKEVELYHFSKRFTERGMAALIFDGPGQGLLLGQKAMEIKFEKVIQACLDFLHTYKTINHDRIGLFGVSFGGYLALRSSAHLANKIKACINLSGGFDLDNFDALSTRLKNDFSYVFQNNLPTMSDIANQRINLKNVPSPKCQVLCIHGEHDKIFTMSSCLRVKDWCKEGSLLYYYANENHVCQNYFGEFTALMSDWMGEQLH